MLVRNIIAMPARWAGWFVDSSGGKHATMAVRTEYVTTKLPAPNMSGFFRPTVSRMSVMKLHTHSVSPPLSRSNTTEGVLARSS